MLVLELDKENPTIRLGENGAEVHPSYPLGLNGRVIGKLTKGINYELIYQDYFKNTVPTFKDGAGNAWYSFESSMPVQTITQGIADTVSPGGYKHIKSAKHAEVSMHLANGNWLESGKTKANGGVSTQEFVDALQANDGSAALTLYTPSEVNAYIKDKSMRVFQLGNTGGDRGLQVFFGLKRGSPWYKGMLEEPVGDNEVELVSVVNNEPGASGMALPAILTKAIENGATVLDAFAVKSERFPHGFLPEMYAQFGFEPIGRIEFDEQYAVTKTDDMSDDEHARLTKLKLADLRHFWQNGGWKEADGYPDVVVMRWMGKDENRAGTIDRYVRTGETSVPEARVGRIRATATDAHGQRDTEGSGSGGLGSANSSPIGGDQRASNAAPLVRRAHDSIQELANLSDGDTQQLVVTAAPAPPKVNRP